MKTYTDKIYSLDLHGTRHKDVAQKIDRFVGEHLLKGTLSIEVITGHSIEMKNLVRKTLGDYELFAEESLFNKGKLIINLM